MFSMKTRRALACSILYIFSFFGCRMFLGMVFSAIVCKIEVKVSA